MLLEVCAPLTYSNDLRCLAIIPRWTYNDASNRCEQFMYGGCGGSANNFDTEEACQKKCRLAVPVISTPSPDRQYSAEGGECI